MKKPSRRKVFCLVAGTVLVLATGTLIASLIVGIVLNNYRPLATVALSAGFSVLYAGLFLGIALIFKAHSLSGQRSRRTMMVMHMLRHVMAFAPLLISGIMSEVFDWRWSLPLTFLVITAGNTLFAMSMTMRQPRYLMT